MKSLIAFVLLCSAGTAMAGETTVILKGERSLMPGPDKVSQDPFADKNF